MPWNATDALDDARWATQSLLWPIDTGRWLRLALIVLFVGGAGGGVPSGGGNVGNVDVGEPAPPSTDVGPALADVPTALVAAGAALLVLAVLVVLALILLGPVMEFVLVEGLRTGTVRVRRPFRRYLGAGLQLLLFRLALLIAIAAAVLVPIAGVVLAGMSVSAAFLALLLPFMFVLFAAALLYGVVMRLTTDFVVPTMIAEGRGIVDGWRRVFPLLRREWREFGLYLVLRFVLGIAAGIAAGLAMGALALLAALPFAAVGALVFLGLGGAGALGLAGLVALGALALGWLLCVIVVGLFVQVPVVTYFRYYALCFLGEEDPALDLVADIRDAAVPTEGR